MTKLFVMLLALVAWAASCKKESVSEIGTFNLVSPANGAKDVVAQTPFSWEPAAAAITYTLQVSSKSDFSKIEFEIKNINSTNFTLTDSLKDGYCYYWRVTAVNPKYNSLAANSGISFRIKSRPLQPSPDISKYFISPSGEDNPDHGSLTEPFKTLAYAATRVPPSEGDTLFLLAGNYLETEPAIIPERVSVIGAGEEETILTSSGVTLPEGIDPQSADFKLWYDGTLIQLVSPQREIFRNQNSGIIAPAKGNQTLSGFTIDGNNKKLKAGVWVENRNNVTMHHVAFKNLQQRGAVFAPGNKAWYTYPTYYMTGIVIHDCSFLNSGVDLSDETLGNLNIAQLDGAQIYNLTISDNQGYGIKFIYDGYFKNLSLHDCTISVNESDPKWGEDISIELWNVGPGNQIFNVKCATWLSIVNHPEMFGDPNGTENMKLFNIKMIDADGVSNIEAIEIGAPGIELYDSYFENKGIGAAVWDMGRSNITIHHNIFYNTTEKVNWADGAAVYIDNSRTWPFKNINVFNNVFDTHYVTIDIKGTNISNINVQNNAFLNTTSTDIYSQGSAIVFTNNLKYNAGNATDWVISGVSASNNLLGDPGYNDTGNRFDTYYMPSSGNSPVVDKGIKVGLPFQGIAPDIGRWEF